jgi:hypothetical protein
MKSVMFHKSVHACVCDIFVELKLLLWAGPFVIFYFTRSDTSHKKVLNYLLIKHKQI